MPAAKLPPMPVVMISSTISDLSAYRAKAEEVCLELDMHPLMMEHRPATGRDKVEDSLSMVDEADVYVGIVGWRYGELPQGYDKSLTEMEYDRAVERRIKRILLLRKGAPPKSVTAAPIDAHASKLVSFRRRLQEEIAYREFATKSELQVKLAAALSNHLTETYKALLGQDFDFLDDGTIGCMQERSHNLANLYARRVAEWFAQRFAELEAVASREELRTNNPRAHERVLPKVAQQQEKYPGGVYSLNELGVVLCHSTPRHPDMNIVNYNASHRDYFKECMSQLRPIVCNSFRSANRPEDILVIAVPRFDNAGNFIGILDAVTDVSTAPFDEMASQVLGDLACAEELSGHRVTLLLLDQRSVVLGSNNRRLTGRNFGGHHAIMDLDTSSTGDASKAEVSTHGATRQVHGTPLITVAFWSRQ
jgi:hypothetical protein